MQNTNILQKVSYTVHTVDPDAKLFFLAHVQEVMSEKNRIGIF